MEQVRAQVQIEGLVQGVFFRYSTQQKAQELGVNGWVRNLPDGNVECLLEGDRDNVEALMQWCHHGPSGAHVDKVSMTWEPFQGDCKGFFIKH